MTFFKTLLLFCSLIISLSGYSQDKRKFKVHTIAFYNVENLFDTINDTQKFDEASPIMEMSFNREEVYEKKVKNMARVISEIGSDVSKNSPAIIGIAEVETERS